MQPRGDIWSTVSAGRRVQPVPSGACHASFDKTKPSGICGLLMERSQRARSTDGRGGAGFGHAAFCSSRNFSCWHSKSRVTYGQMLWINPQLQRIKPLLLSPLSLLVTSLHFRALFLCLQRCSLSSLHACRGKYSK